MHQVSISVGEKMGKSPTFFALNTFILETNYKHTQENMYLLGSIFRRKKSKKMASIKERKDKDGKTRYHVQIRIKGQPPQYESFRK